MQGRTHFLLRWRWFLLGWLILLLVLGGWLVAASIGRAAGGRLQSSGGILARDLTLTSQDFVSGESKGPLTKDAGLALTLPGTGVYTSEIVVASLPFSDLGCTWQVDLPTGAGMLVEVRTSPDLTGDRWTGWQVLEEAYETPPLAMGEHGSELLPISQRDGVHRRLQYRLSFSSLQAGTTVNLERLTFHFIDARSGPSTDQIASRKVTVAGIEKPPVIGRAEWGCPDGENSPLWPQEYQTVTHVIVHHTATDNDDTDWAARVRAIWYYHTYTRGWGDIGYNYLIDPRGNVYHGRAGEDEVIGGHARSYNPGTMGVGCLGTYTSAPVPTPLLASLERLIAWKARQRNIDPLGRSFNNHKVYDHIAGHRDVGQTTCPGDRFYGLLPTIRQAVADLLAQPPNSTLVDDRDPAFSRSPVYGHDRCGLVDHGLWTHTTTDPNLAANWGIWRPVLPQTGQYEVLVYVPDCTGDLPQYTSGAHYRVYYRGGGSEVVVDQQAARGQWVSLGVYPFEAGDSGYVYLDDMADDHWRSLWYDSVRWDLLGAAPLPPVPPSLQAPDNYAWVNSRQIQLSWKLPTTMTVDGVRLVVSIDPALADPILDTALGAVESYLLVIDRDSPALYWSVQARNSDGYSGWAPVRRFSVDSTPPVSSVTTLYRTRNGVYLLLWNGSDEGIGLASFAVQVRHGSGGEWQDLLTDVTGRSGVVPFPEGIDYYRVHARDWLGNQEAPHGGDGDLASDQAVTMEWSWSMPLVLRSAAWPTPLPQPTQPDPTAGSAPTALPEPEPTVTLAPPPTLAPVLPTRLPSPTPSGAATSLPDLVLIGLGSSQGQPSDCGRPAGIAVTVANLGPAPAGPFTLLLEGDPALADCRWQLDGLLPGRQSEYICPVVLYNSLVTATVDPVSPGLTAGAVQEMDERNNVISTVLTVLQVPPCTPKPR